MITLDGGVENRRAGANIHKEGNDYLALNENGEYLENGNFIFSCSIGEYKNKIRAMVLTQNNGEYIESGYMKETSVIGSNWKDLDNWIGKFSKSYHIANFNGTKGITICLCNLNL